MNDFYDKIFQSILNNINNESHTKQSLLDRVREDFDNEIDDVDILPLLEKCNEKKVIKTLESDLLVITDVGLNLLSNPSNAYEKLWILTNEANVIENPNESPYQKTHIDSLNDLKDTYNTYLLNLKKYIKFLLMNMNEYKFEELVIKILVASAEASYGEVTKKSGDGGVDGYLYKTLLKQGAMPVQIKRYAENNLVSVNDIRDFIGSIHQSHYYDAYFVTTSTFTNIAIEKAKQRGIILINGNELVDLIIKTRFGLITHNGLEFLITPNLKVYD